MANFTTGAAGGLARGLQFGLSLRESRRDREARQAELEAAAAEAQRERTRESLEKLEADAKEGFEQGVVLLEQLAPQVEDEDPRFQQVQRAALASLMTFANVKQQIIEMARADGVPEEAITLFGDPQEFIQRHIPILEGRIAAARNASRAVQTLSPEQVASAGFPEGSVVQQDTDGKLSLVFNASEDGSALQERIQALVSSGVPENMAEGIAAGRFTVLADPVTREGFVMDIATGDRVGELTPTPGGGPTPSVVPEDIETGAALGVGGGLANLTNIVTDAIGAGLAFPKAQEATDAIQQIQTTTKLALQVAIPGRPAKDIRDDLENLTVSPNNVLQGEQRALSRFRQMKRFIDNSIAERREALNGRLNPTERAGLEANIRELEVMQRSYQTLIDGFGESGIDGKAASDAALEALAAGDRELARAIIDAAEADDQEKLQELLGGGDE